MQRIWDTTPSKVPIGKNYIWHVEKVSPNPCTILLYRQCMRPSCKPCSLYEVAIHIPVPLHFKGHPRIRFKSPSKEMSTLTTSLHWSVGTYMYRQCLHVHMCIRFIFPFLIFVHLSWRICDGNLQSTKF